MINKLSTTQKVAICIAVGNFFLGEDTYNGIWQTLFLKPNRYAAYIGDEIEMATYAICVVLFLLFRRKKGTE